MAFVRLAGSLHALECSCVRRAETLSVRQPHAATTLHIIRKHGFLNSHLACGVLAHQRRHLQTRRALVLPLPPPLLMIIVLLLLLLVARRGELLPRRRSMTLLIFRSFFSLCVGCAAPREADSRGESREPRNKKLKLLLYC